MDDDKDRFVLTVDLYTNSYAYPRLGKRFKLARMAYNAMLREVEKRRRKCQSSQSFSDAMALRKAYHALVKEIAVLGAKEGDEEDTKRLVELEDQVGQLLKQSKQKFAEAETESGWYLRSSSKSGRTNSLEQFVAKLIPKNCYISEHLDSNTRNKLMERAFKASQRAATAPKRKNKRTGQYERPHVRFRSQYKISDEILSLEGKSHESPMRLDFKKGQPLVVWSGLEIPIINFKNDPKIWPILETELAERQRVLVDGNKPQRIVTYVRICRQMVRNKWMYRAQLICRGTPIKKQNHKLGKGEIGADLGPSLIAYVSDEKAHLGLLSGDLKDSNLFHKLMGCHRKLQRQIDRQRRNNNPANYNEDGTVKRGSKRWVRSKRQRRNERKLADLMRRVAELRSCSHGALLNEMRAHGDVLKFDDDNYKTWQKTYGKSVGNHAPGSFVQKAKHKFASTGGRVDKINTRKSKSSQRCPKCGNIEKKGLTEGKDNRSIRIHVCKNCGFEMQRDLTSAVVNKFFDIERNTLDGDESKRFVMEKGPLLRCAVERVIQSAREGHFMPSTFGKLPELERIARNDVEPASDATSGLTTRGPESLD